MAEQDEGWIMSERVFAQKLANRLRRTGLLPFRRRLPCFAFHLYQEEDQRGVRKNQLQHGQGHEMDQ
jgi:hypothetical protein